MLDKSLKPTGTYTPNNYDQALLDAAAQCGLYQALVTYNPPHWVFYVGPVDGSLFQTETAKGRLMVVYNDLAKEWRFV